MPAPTDPVSIGRSEFTGKWYGTVDVGARATSIDGDEARFAALSRSAVGRVCHQCRVRHAHRRTGRFEGQAWNIGYRDQRYHARLRSGAAA